MDDNLFLQEKEHLLPNETLNKIPEKSDQTLRQQNFPILPTKLKINKFLIKRKISTKFNTKLIHSPNKQKVLSVNSNEVKTNKFIILKKEPHESVQIIESKEINLPLTKIEKLESKFITSPTIASNKTSNKTIKLILKSEKISDGMVTKTELIQSPQISQRVAGFYWQHISYVVIWWFMALLVLVLPLFPQMRQRSYISIAADQSKKAKVVKK